MALDGKELHRTFFVPFMECLDRVNKKINPMPFRQAKRQLGRAYNDCARPGQSYSEKLAAKERLKAAQKDVFLARIDPDRFQKNYKPRSALSFCVRENIQELAYTRGNTLRCSGNYRTFYRTPGSSCLDRGGAVAVTFGPRRGFYKSYLRGNQAKWLHLTETRILFDPFNINAYVDGSSKCVHGVLHPHILYDDDQICLGTSVDPGTGEDTYLSILLNRSLLDGNVLAYLQYLTTFFSNFTYSTRTLHPHGGYWCSPAKAPIIPA